MTSRQRSSSARSNNSDHNVRQASTPSPSHYPQQNGSAVPEDLILNDVPTYSRNNSSNLLIPSQGIGSPYPAISGGTPPLQGVGSGAQRPRASTTDQPAGQQNLYRNTPFRAAPRGPVPLEYIQGHRFPSNSLTMDSRPPSILDLRLNRSNRIT